VKKREQARMGDALDEGGIVNVAIAEKPVAPALPRWPPAIVVLAGFAGAVASGTGAAFTADYLDPALRTPEEVTACLELPVLASLPGGRRTRLSA
jgi:capsular polysaccharide biosynthesis protein